MTAPPKCRWFRFGLRTMFVIVALVAMAMGWLAYTANWARQRRDLIARDDIEALVTMDGDLPSAPGLLRLFGEKGRDDILMVIDAPIVIDPRFGLDESTPIERELTLDERRFLDRAKILFPEATAKVVSLTYMRAIKMRP